MIKSESYFTDGIVVTWMLTKQVENFIKKHRHGDQLGGLGDILQDFLVHSLCKEGITLGKNDTPEHTTEFILDETLMLLGETGIATLGYEWDVVKEEITPKLRNMIETWVDENRGIVINAYLFHQGVLL